MDEGEEQVGGVCVCACVCVCVCVCVCTQALRGLSTRLSRTTPCILECILKCLRKIEEAMYAKLPRNIF
jgi:hypothetical protein